MAANKALRLTATGLPGPQNISKPSGRAFFFSFKFGTPGGQATLPLVWKAPHLPSGAKKKLFFMRYEMALKKMGSGWAASGPLQVFQKKPASGTSFFREDGHLPLTWSLNRPQPNSEANATSYICNHKASSSFYTTMDHLHLNLCT